MKILLLMPSASAFFGMAFMLAACNEVLGEGALLLVEVRWLS